jgi:hypothetical protein
MPLRPSLTKVLLLSLLSCCIAGETPDPDEQLLSPFEWKSKFEAQPLQAGQAPGIDQIRPVVENYLKAHDLKDFELIEIRFFSLGLNDFWAIRLDFDLLVNGPPSMQLVLYADFQLKLYTAEEFESLRKASRTPLRSR